MKKFYLLLLIALSANALFAQRFVKEGGAGTKDGLSWANASDDLQAMINASSSGQEVWVAAGTYKPTEKLQSITYTNPQQNIPTTDRDKAFIMKGGVKVYGGFAGIETLLSERNYTTNVTILSGDLNGDDVPKNDGDYIAKKADNVYHVVSCRNNADGAVLDGFTIKNGYADGTASVSGSGTNGLSSTTISQNSGGGIAVRGTNTQIAYANLIIQDCYASGFGGGASLYISGSGTFSFSNVIFKNNKNDASGGGGLRVFVSAGNPVLNIIASKFMSNSSENRGGGAYIYGNSSTVYPITSIVNSLFYDNSSASSTLGGGGLSLSTGSQNTVTNCTFYSNKATNAAGEGGAIHVANSPSTYLNLYNSILNGNTSGTGTSNDIFKGTDAPALIIKNTLGQTANYITDGVDYNIINASPTILFASTILTEANFLQLATGSLAINKGDKGRINGYNDDLAGNPRVYNDIQVDLGAYEYQGTLPVTLDYFKATKQSNSALLTWKTLSENNSQKFVLERGVSPDKFTVIKTIPSVGAGIYNYTDNNPLAGTNYYRLIQYDNDGASTVLGIKVVSFDLNEKVQVYPNPSNKYVWVKPPPSNTIVSLNLISLTGKVIATNSYASSATNEAVKLDLVNVPTGTYILWINKGKSNAEKQTLLVVNK